MLGETIFAEEKARKAMIDAVCLTDELCVERNSLRCQKREGVLRSTKSRTCTLHSNLDEAETLAMRGGKKVLVRPDQKIKDLETQLDDETRRLVDAQKA